LLTPAQDATAQLIRLKRRFERERSARLEAEVIAERGLRELYEKTEQLELLGAIAVAANESTSIDDALRFALTAICQSIGWSLGHAYIATHTGSIARLAPTTLWHDPNNERTQIFHRATEATEFPLDVGLPGRVLASAEPAWIVDIASDGNFPRMQAALAAGIRSAFAFPVLAGSEVVAVLEFFTDRPTPRNDFLLHLMGQIGTQLGRVVERTRAENQLIHDASHDPLTKLPNRTLFLDRLTRAIARYRRHPDALFAVLFVDLDRFKLVNDSLGHHAGDDLIIQMSGRLAASLRSNDTVSRASDTRSDTGSEVRRNTRSEVSMDDELATLARLGGDEFTILLDDLSDLSDAVRVADRILQTLTLPFSIDGHEVYVSASIGIAWSATGYTAADEVLHDADLAMYRAKTLGKARYEIYDQNMFAMAINRLDVETNLRRALQRNEFELHYQPILALSSNTLVGFEALVRWRKSPTELVYPDEFIGVAEDTGLILFIDTWVLREACRTMHQWHQEFPRPEPLSISVNLSARQFARPDLVQQIRQILAETEIDPRSVRLEITESVSMADSERTVTVLSELKQLGVRFSIDDFGTGFSSLSYLHRFPLDLLKIDRSFVSRMALDKDSLAIIQTILSLARNLGMEVVAEGTETEAHVAQLASLDCEYGQGYFFSRPLQPEAARTLLQTP
jgi:predicted signal transduction protein with EAL and GGDEF domain